MELGAVFIGTEGHGYSVREGQSKGNRSGRWRFGVTLETPDRQFVFLCDQEQDQREWIEAFKLVISQPMLPQHYNSKKTIHCSPCLQYTSSMRLTIIVKVVNDRKLYF